MRCSNLVGWEIGENYENVSCSWSRCGGLYTKSKPVSSLKIVKSEIVQNNTYIVEVKVEGGSEYKPCSGHVLGRCIMSRES